MRAAFTERPKDGEQIQAMASDLFQQNQLDELADTGCLIKRRQRCAAFTPTRPYPKVRVTQEFVQLVKGPEFTEPPRKQPPQIRGHILALVAAGRGKELLFDNGKKVGILYT